MKLIACFIYAFLFFISESWAANDAFLSEMCNVINIVTGNAGKTFAAFTIASVGIGFYTGKISWGLMVGVSVGVAAMFGAPSIVSAVSGKAIYQCDSSVTYRACSGSNCSCPVGYTGVTCSDCATGYVGSGCSTCDTGYKKISGVCLKSCNSGATVGVNPKDVDAGTGSLNCDASPNFAGSINYDCSAGNFSVVGSPCACAGKRAGVDCSSCILGYQGANCDSCISGYTMVSSNCSKDCKVTSVTGITDNTPAIPTSGTITCNASDINGDPYLGLLDYSCINGSFSVTQGVCVLDSSCTGGSISTITSLGVTYKVHTFTTSGIKLRCPSNKTVEFLIVAGGGGGGNRHAGGGGGGGMISGTVSLTAGVDYTAVVGGGGTEPAANSSGGNGQKVLLPVMSQMVVAAVGEMV